MSESQGLALAPPTPGTEQHGGEARRGLFVRSEVGEGKQADGNCTLFFFKGNLELLDTNFCGRF